MRYTTIKPNRGVRFITPFSERKNGNLRQQYEQRRQMVSLFDPIFNTSAQDLVSRKYGQDYNILLGYLELASNNIKPYFQGETGKGIMNNMMLLGDSADQLFGASIIKSGIIAGQGDGTWSENIAKAYGVGRGGRYQMDTSRIRENMDVDLGTVGNLVFDLAGEVLLDPSTYFTMGASGAAKGVISKTDEVADLAKVVGDEKIAQRLGILALEGNEQGFKNLLSKTGKLKNADEVDDLFKTISKAVKEQDSSVRRIFKFLDEVENTMNKTALHFSPPYLAFKYAAKPGVRKIGSTAVDKLQDYRVKKQFLEYEKDEVYIELKAKYGDNQDALLQEIENVTNRIASTKSAEDMEYLQKLVYLRRTQFNEFTDARKKFFTIVEQLRLRLKGSSITDINEHWELVEDLYKVLKDNPNLRRDLYGRTEYRRMLKALNHEIDIRVKGFDREISQYSSEMNRLDKQLKALINRIANKDKSAVDKILKIEKRIEELNELIKNKKFEKDELISITEVTTKSEPLSKVADSYQFTEDDLDFLATVDLVFKGQGVLTMEQINAYIEGNAKIYEHIQTLLNGKRLTRTMASILQTNDSLAATARTLRNYDRFFNHHEWLEVSDPLNKGLTKVKRVEAREDLLTELLGEYDDELLDSLIDTRFSVSLGKIKNEHPEAYKLISEKLGHNPQMLNEFDMKLREINRMEWRSNETIQQQISKKIQDAKVKEANARDFIHQNIDVTRVQLEIERFYGSLKPGEKVTLETLRHRSPMIYDLLVPIEEFNPDALRHLQNQLSEIDKQISGLEGTIDPSELKELANLKTERAEISRRIKDNQSYDVRAKGKLISYRKEHQRLNENLIAKGQEKLRLTRELKEASKIDVPTLEARHAEIEPRVGQLKEELNVLAKRNDVIDRRIKGLNLDDPTEIDLVESEISQLRKDRINQEHHVRLNRLYNDLENELDNPNLTKIEIQSLRTRLSEVKDNINYLEHHIKNKITIDEIDKKISELEVKRDSLPVNNKQLKKEELLIRRDELNNEYNALKTQYDNLNKELKKIESDLELGRRGQDVLPKQIEKVEREARQIQHRMNLADARNKRLPANNLSTIIPELNEFSNIRNRIEFLNTIFNVSQSGKKDFLVRMSFIEHFRKIHGTHNTASQSLLDTNYLLNRTEEFYNKVSKEGAIVAESGIEELRELDRIYRINQVQESIGWISRERSNKSIKEITDTLDGILEGLPQEEKLLGVKSTLLRYFSYLKFKEPEEVMSSIIELREKPELMVNWFALTEGLRRYLKDVDEVQSRAKYLFDYILNAQNRILEPGYELTEQQIGDIMYAHRKTMDAINNIELDGIDMVVKQSDAEIPQGFKTYTFNKMKQEFKTGIKIESRENVTNGYMTVLKNNKNIDFDLKDPNVHYIFIDFETTGTVNNDIDFLDQIIEAAAQELHFDTNGNPVFLNQYKPNGNRLIRLNADKSMSEDAKKITGISDEMLKDENLDDLKTAMQDVVKILLGSEKGQRRVFVAHNAQFDWDMLINTLKKLGLYDTYKEALDDVVVLDTMGMAKMLFNKGEIGSLKEESIADFFFKYDPELHDYNQLPSSARSRMDADPNLNKLHRANYDVTIGSEMFISMLNELDDVTTLKGLHEFRNESLTKVLDELTLDIDMQGRFIRTKKVDKLFMNVRQKNYERYVDSIYNERTGVIIDIQRLVGDIDDLLDNSNMLYSSGEYVDDFSEGFAMLGEYDDEIKSVKQVVDEVEFKTFLGKVSNKSLTPKDLNEIMDFLYNRVLNSLQGNSPRINALRKKFTEMTKRTYVDLSDMEYMEESYTRLAQDIVRVQSRLSESTLEFNKFKDWFNLDGSVKNQAYKYINQTIKNEIVTYNYEEYVDHLQGLLDSVRYLKISDGDEEFLIELIMENLRYLPHDLSKASFEDMYFSLKNFFDNVRSDISLEKLGDATDPQLVYKGRAVQSEVQELDYIVKDLYQFYETIDDIYQKYNYDAQLIKHYRDKGIGFGYMMKNQNLTNLELNEVIINSPTLEKLNRILNGDFSFFENGTMENMFAEVFEKEKNHPLVKEIKNIMDEVRKSAEFIDDLFKPYINNSNPPISQIYDILNSIDYLINRFKVDYKIDTITDDNLVDLQAYLIDRVFKPFIKGEAEVFDGWQNVIDQVLDRAISKPNQFISKPDKAFTDGVYTRLKRLGNTMEYYFAPERKVVGDAIKLGGVDDYIKLYNLMVEESVEEVRRILRDTSLMNTKLRSKPITINDVRVTLDEYEGALVRNNYKEVFRFDDTFKEKQRLKRVINESTKGNTIENTLPKGSPAKYTNVEDTKMYTIYDFIAKDLGVSTHEFARYVGYYDKKTYKRLKNIHIFKRGGLTQLEKQIDQMFLDLNITWLADVDEQKDRILSAYIDIKEKMNPELFAYNETAKQYTHALGQAKNEVNHVYRDINRIMFATNEPMKDVFGFFGDNDTEFLNFFKSDKDLNLIIYQPDNTIRRIQLNDVNDVQRLKQMHQDGNLISVVNKNDYIGLKKYFNTTNQSALHKYFVTAHKLYSLMNIPFIVGNIIEGFAKNVMSGQNPMTLWEDFTNANKAYDLWMTSYVEASKFDEMFTELGWSAKYRWMDWFYELQDDGSYLTKAGSYKLKDGTEQVIKSRKVSKEEYEIVKKAHEFFMTEAGSGDMQEFSKTAEALDNKQRKKSKNDENNLFGYLTYNEAITTNFKLTSRIEGVSRYAMYMNGTRHGLLPDEAFTKVLDSFFSYGGKSQAELMAEFMIPFISFPMRNYMYFMEILENPHVSKTFARSLELAWGDTEVNNNDYLQYQLESGAIPISDRTLFDTNLGFTDAFTLVGDPFGSAKRKLHPFWKLGNAGLQSIQEGSADLFKQQARRYPGISTVMNAVDSVSNLASPERSLDGTMGSLFSRYYSNEYYKYNRYYTKNIYNDLYTRGGLKRWDLQSQMPSQYNLKYKTQSILYNARQSPFSIQNKRRSRF